MTTTDNPRRGGVPLAPADHAQADPAAGVVRTVAALLRATTGWDAAAVSPDATTRLCERLRAVVGDGSERAASADRADSAAQLAALCRLAAQMAPHVDPVRRVSIDGVDSSFADALATVVDEIVAVRPGSAGSWRAS